MGKVTYKDLAAFKNFLDQLLKMNMQCVNTILPGLIKTKNFFNKLNNAYLGTFNISNTQIENGAKDFKNEIDAFLQE